MLYKTLMIENGDILVPYYIYKCEECGEEIEEAWPREVIDGKDYCGDCAFKLGLITEREYIKTHLRSIRLNGMRAAVRDGKIFIQAYNGKFPWERDPKKSRLSNDYLEWRTAVLERDAYTCAICGQVGGKLNVHHIKSFKEFPEERVNVDNGITLCERCHKKVHKEKNSEWIYTASQKSDEK